MVLKTIQPHSFRVFLLFLAIIFSPGAGSAENQKSATIENVWVSLEGEPFLTFQRARERFLAEDYEDAGRFVRKGAAFLWLETERADVTNMKGLESSAANLGKVAKQVEEGLLANGRSLEVAFARAHLAMARHFGSLSQHYEALGETHNATRAMDISAGHLLAANHWSPEGLEVEEISGVKKTRSALDKAGGGTEDAKKALGNAFKRLNKGMEKLSKHIRFYEGEQQ